MQVIEIAWLLAVIAFLTIPLGRWDLTIGIAVAGAILYAILKLILKELKDSFKDEKEPKTRR